MATLGIAQTISFILRRRPVLEQVLRSFEPLLEKRAALVKELSSGIGKNLLPPFSREKAGKGVPVLAAQPVYVGEYIRQSARTLLPFFWQWAGLAACRENLEKFFLQAPDTDLQALLDAVLAGAEAAELARQYNLSMPVLAFVADFVLSAVIRALADLYPITEKGWEEEGVWQEGYCPFCGAWPAIGWLEKRDPLKDDNPYLAGGGGKKHLYCPMCATDWPFRRGVCPGCGAEGEGAVQILKEAGSQGERLDWCSRCKTYCPTVDLRELADLPNMDVMTPGMLHLGIVAADRQLSPLAPSIWNML